jgi:hypothetical protein
MILVIAFFTIIGALSLTALAAAVSSLENMQSLFADYGFETAAKFQRTSL